MRLRALLIVATMLLGVVMLSGVALAKNITGTNGPDRLIGTPNKDQIYGLGGPDYLSGKPSADALYGGRAKTRCAPETAGITYSADRVPTSSMVAGAMM